MGIIQRKLEQLAGALKLRRPRWITILVDANEEDQSAAHAIAHEVSLRVFVRSGARLRVSTGGRGSR
jgi:hypothetical protein